MQHEGYVQYGAGWDAPASWVNFDASPTLRLQRIPVVGALVTRNRPTFSHNVQYGDIVRGLPIPPQSCSAIYCSHVLEHLTLSDFRTALRNTCEYLKPGGVFRNVQPDLERFVRHYLSRTEGQPSVDFMESSLLGCVARPRRLRNFVVDWLGNSQHQWLWDYRSMIVELENAGFTSIRRAAFGDAEDPRFQEVENPDRWKDCLGIECRRPAT